MACSKRESTNEIAGFGGLKLSIPAISNAAASEKQILAQSLRTLFTDDNVWVGRSRSRRVVGEFDQGVMHSCLQASRSKVYRKAQREGVFLTRCK
jgi:hypothetical protein